MTPFTQMTAIAAPLLRDNVDTDAIIPSREMKTVGKTGLADGLFAGWRYRAVGTRDADPDFVLNRADYREARFLISGANFGCGSSREHAAWALLEYGFRAIMAVSFNPIFYGNCVRNGIVPVVLTAETTEALAAAMPAPVTVSLETMDVSLGARRVASFDLPGDVREALMLGLDPIGQTLLQRDRIDAFLLADRARRPWIYQGGQGGA